MDIVRFRYNGETTYGVLRGKVFPILDLDTSTLDEERFAKILKPNRVSDRGISIEDVQLLPFNPRPKRIIGIGLNYVEHASDLDEKRPEEYPVIFFKFQNSIIGQGDSILIPDISERTTGEAELGIVIQKDGRNIPEDSWQEFTAGLIPIIDMTAEDILRKNTRYLGLSKVFDTFISIGSQLKTIDSVESIDDIRVRTTWNGETVGENSVGNMMFRPSFLVSFISRIMPLQAGDIISTGTPKSTPLSDGGTVGCEISGFIPLTNPVVDVKMRKRR